MMKSAEFEPIVSLQIWKKESRTLQNACHCVSRTWLCLAKRACHSIRMSAIMQLEPRAGSLVGLSPAGDKPLKSLFMRILMPSFASGRWVHRVFGESVGMVQDMTLLKGK